MFAANTQLSTSKGPDVMQEVTDCDVDALAAFTTVKDKFKELYL